MDIFAEGSNYIFESDKQILPTPYLCTEVRCFTSQKTVNLIFITERNSELLQYSVLIKIVFAKATKRRLTDDRIGDTPNLALYAYTPASSGLSPMPLRFPPERFVTTNVHVSRMAGRLEGKYASGDNLVVAGMRSV